MYLAPVMNDQSSATDATSAMHPGPAGEPAEAPSEAESGAPPGRRRWRRGDAPQRVFDPGAWLGVLVFGAVGIGLRVGWALRLGEDVRAWEADGFVRALAAQGLGAWNRVFPALTGMLFREAGAAGGWTTVVELRLVSVAVSVAALVACLDLAVVVSRDTGLGLRSVGRSLRWVVLVWALHPTLIDAATRPTEELLLGGVGCIVLASIVRWGAGGGALRWVLLAASFGLALVAGGLLLALPLAVGVLVFLIPVPRMGSALPLLAAVAVAAGAWWYVGARGDGNGLPPGPFRPPSAPAYGAADLVGAPPPHPTRIPLDPDRREDSMFGLVAEAWGQRTVPWMVGRMLDRVMLDQLAGAQFEAVPLPSPLSRTVLTLLDLFVRGGVILFAVAVSALLRPKTESAWPRGGVVAGLIVMALVSVAGAVRPGALAPFDLVVLGVAGGGMAGTGAGRRAGVRRFAFAVGGLLLCSLTLAPRLTGRPPRVWDGPPRQPNAQGADLVRLLAGDGPQDVVGQVQAANRLMEIESPFTRIPEAALEHALVATELAPTEDAVSELLVRAYVENQRLDEGKDFAETWLASDGTSRPARVTLDWLGAYARRLRSESNP